MSLTNLFYNMPLYHAMVATKAFQPILDDGASPKRRVLVPDQGFDAAGLLIHS
ncbi:hypothetical protein NC652_000247 [Populus alba x Populus x berolinensis]|nr:hypothetical protein NC652_000247 [Populus alba x Populus x berolinensis]